MLRAVGDCGTGDIAIGEANVCIGLAEMGELSGDMAVGVTGDLMARDSAGLVTGVGFDGMAVTMLRESLGFMALEASMMTVMFICVCV